MKPPIEQEREASRMADTRAGGQDESSLWSDEINSIVDAAFDTVSRNPSDHETAVAYRRGIARLLDDNERLRDSLAMSIAEMSRVRGRLEIIGTCNEDNRLANALGSTCDHIRRQHFSAALTGDSQNG